MEAQQNQSAFPTGDHSNVQPEYGISKLEYFSGIAMQGFIANSNIEVCDKITVNNGWHHPETIAKLAVQIARALINELNDIP
ncbi:MAG: hypothetical protein JWQ09_5814 [Segetibacter sp.]|nr:hypothetical protein [Segetibacter sp.]